MSLPKKKVVIFIVTFIVLLLIISPITAYLVANFNAKSKVSSFTLSIKGRCNITYGDVSYNIINRHLVIDDFLFKCDNEKMVFAKKAEFNHIVDASPVPSNMQVDITGGIFYINNPVFKIYSEYAKKLGYENINFQGRITYTLGIKSKEFKLVTFKIFGENIGNFDVEMKVPNVYDKNIYTIANNILNNRPAGLTINFEDKGLKNTVIKKFAEITGNETDNVTKKVNNAIYKRMVNTDNKTKANYSQLEKFILNSNKISMSLSENDNSSIIEAVSLFDITGYRKFLNSIKNINVNLVVK